MGALRCGWILPVAVVGLCGLGGVLRANTMADGVVDYNPGDESGGATGYQNGGGPAVGLPSTVDASFDPTNVTPFSPAYDGAVLTQIKAGGQITLHFAQTVTDGAGADIGVFAATGIIADSSSSPTNPSASSGPATFTNPVNAAIVSVSPTGAAGSFVALNGGNPITLNLPTNGFLDSTVTYDPSEGFVDAEDGTTVANPYKPFTPAGGLAAFSGLTYTEMLALFNGSAGGTWLDLSGTGLSAVNYIRFAVPVGADYQLTLDAVTAAPEPGSMGVLALAAVGLLRRRAR